MIRPSMRKTSEPQDFASAGAGFSLIELLVSASILIVATTVFMQSTRISSTSSRSGDALIRVQSLVSRDLQWLRAYAHAWNCQSGCSSNSSTPLRYQPVACSTLVADFLGAADVSAAAEGIAATPLATTVVLESINGSNLSRTISLPTVPSGTSGSLPQSLVVSYSYGGNPSFQRRGSLLIQAGSWCTT